MASREAAAREAAAREAAVLTVAVAMVAYSRKKGWILHRVENAER